MYPVQFHPSPVKDGRRILGEKPANACLSPARNQNVDAATSPVKRPLSESSSSITSPSKKLLPSLSFAGQKRTIDQAEDPPVNNDGWHIFCGEEYNRMQAAEERAIRLQKKQLSRATDSDVPSTPTPQKKQQPIETRQDLPSSMDVSSNQTHDHNTTRTVPEDPETRKMFIQEKANLLRNRIQSAMRHVKDEQLDRRLSDLEVHSQNYPRSFNRQPQQENQTPKQAVAAAKTTTTTQSTATSPLSETTPRTLQSAPNMNETTSNKDNSAPGLSSPPLSANNTTHDPMRTPTQKAPHHHHPGTSESPTQLSSPPATVMRTCSDTDMAGSGQQAGGMPSHKGDAVDGLLKLMKTADERENLDT